MKIKDFVRYRAVYCGLCHRLTRHCGAHTALLLNYDMAFLILLLCGLYEPTMHTRKARCTPHPLRPHEEIDTPYTEYAADMLMLLSYHQLMDDWRDERRADRLAIAKTISGAYRQAKARYPRQAACIETQIAALSAMEKAGEENLDRVSACTGAMLAEIFDINRDLWSEPLRTLGMGLGQAIYLMDAYEDVEKDVAHGRYNPLRALLETGELHERCETMINACMAHAAAAFERLPVLQDADILRNILYAGVWTRFNAASAKREKAEKSSNSDQSAEKNPPINGEKA